MPFQATPSARPHIRRWAQINLTKLIIIIIIGSRLPSVAIIPTLNIFFPTLTERTTLIIKIVLVEKDAVTASTTLRHIIRSCGPVIIWQVTALTLERGILCLSNRQPLIYRILFHGVATQNFTVILHGSPTITTLSSVTNEIRGH
jgi:hypothetical protein